MKAGELLMLPWIHVDDWSELTTTFPNNNGTMCVCKADILNFATGKFREASAKVRTSYCHLRDVFIQRNEAFYEEVYRVYEEGGGRSCLTLDDPELEKIQKLLRVPDVSARWDPKPLSRPAQILAEIEGLTEGERSSLVNHIFKKYVFGEDVPLQGSTASQSVAEEIATLSDDERKTTLTGIRDTHVKGDFFEGL